MQQYPSYAFRNTDTDIMMLDSIGRQRIDSSEYSFSGESRPDCGHVIFQYTLSGQGYIEIDNTVKRLPKDTAFLVKVPSRHRYYYNEQDEPWEFIWLNIRGAEAQRIWDLVIMKEGHVITRDQHSPLIEGFWKLMDRIHNDKVTDKYVLSAAVYQWLLTLVHSSKEQASELSASTSSIIDKTKRYMASHYALPLTLDMLAEHCVVNKHHLCRLFQRSEQSSPLTYLRERRIEAAISMLRTTELPINEIGKLCGFESPSYFGKVFRQYMSMSPQEYRRKKLEFPYSAIYYE